MSDYEDEKHPSPDSVGSSMTLAGHKKDKTCLVCGDKALGYNFNAISCESCKAFFRRNAHKTIRGRCEGKCDVNVESRSFCKKCRLAKCFTVGMRKDMILDDTQKTIRKQKIIINKLRRHGSLPPEDTYAVTETEMKQAYRQQIVSQSYESLKSQFPSLSDEELKILQSIKTENNAETKLGCSQSNIPQSSSWEESPDSLEDLLLDMTEHDAHILREMNKAHESSSFLSNTQTELKSLPSNPTEVFNVADGFVRRIIKVSKQIEFFRALEKEDQIALLKGSVVEIMMLRSAVNFNVKTETWNLNTSSCIKKANVRSRASSMSSASPSATPSAMSSPTSGDTQSPFDYSLPKNHCDNTSLHDADTIRMQAINRMGGGFNINAMRDNAVKNDFDINAMRNIAINRGMDVDALRRAAAQGASFDTLRNMGRDMSRQQPVQAPTPSPVQTPTDVPPELYKQFPSIPAGMNMTQLRQLGASLGFCSPTGAKADNDSMNPVPETSSISADILKSANPETQQMFLTYSKFIQSLMKTIFGDLIILKFLIMLSLFSPDRDGIIGINVVHKCQEVYARVLQEYIRKRFPHEKSMFAKCIMKLTDVRNINDVHTKMLLKMKIEDIEPLLVEIFDLPT